MQRLCQKILGNNECKTFQFFPYKSITTAGAIAMKTRILKRLSIGVGRFRILGGQGGGEFPAGT